MNSTPAAEAAGTATRPVRIPTHEPWPDHENLDPKTFVPDKTESIPNDERVGTFVNSTQEEAPEFPTLTDTFKRPT
jgi:hypothetical protein